MTGKNCSDLQENEYEKLMTWIMSAPDEQIIGTLLISTGAIKDELEKAISDSITSTRPSLANVFPHLAPYRHHLITPPFDKRPWAHERHSDEVQYYNIPTQWPASGQLESLSKDKNLKLSYADWLKVKGLRTDENFEKWLQEKNLELSSFKELSTKKLAIRLAERAKKLTSALDDHSCPDKLALSIEIDQTQRLVALLSAVL